MLTIANLLLQGAIAYQGTGAAVRVPAEEELFLREKDGGLGMREDVFRL